MSTNKQEKTNVPSWSAEFVVVTFPGTDFTTQVFLDDCGTSNPISVVFGYTTDIEMLRRKP